ncbi:pancreatic alpha-amylase-like protein [Labeo rohita]|uniref:Alpha-amylase n=2 Tax=Labeonini TaxID=2743697 RepID=A0A498MUZ8_LABRO|nr:pancreatic alpha-amylase-like protein [Labeo rohita]
MKLLILAALFGLSFAQFDANTKYGRTAIVHLFEWRWADIAAECERYLGPNGFGGVQISPPSESIIVTNPWHPWWQRYQPIGYNLCSRSGNENELRDMITRCNNVGVNIYVDAVINHMCGAGGGSGTHSSCGSYFDANSKDFPTVPYSYLDFNDGKCSTGSGNIENYGDIYQVRNCRLVGLLDLALEKDYVRGKVADYMNKLIDMGVAGFRVDACKHMWPGEYTGIGRVTEFKYGAKLGNVIRKWNGEKLAYVKNWGEGWGFMPSDKALVFTDNHNNQRGHGAGGASIVTFWDSRLYKMAVAFMLAHPYGFTRVMSSYRWDRNIVNGQDQNDWQGPPSNSDGSTKPVPINPDSTCGDGWVCEHRWRQIKNMVAFRNVVNGQAFSNWWDNGNNQISFSRGSKGFLVINNDDWELNETLTTGLPAGTYCDVISGQKESGRCTGKQVVVGGDGRASIRISNQEEDPFIAIHADSKL